MKGARHRLATSSKRDLRHQPSIPSRPEKPTLPTPFSLDSDRADGVTA